MRRNPDGTILTWLAVRRGSGESVLVDDRTFDPAKYMAADEAVAESAPDSDAPAKSGKSKKAKE